MAEDEMEETRLGMRLAKWADGCGPEEDILVIQGMLSDGLSQQPAAQTKVRKV